MPEPRRFGESLLNTVVWPYNRVMDWLRRNWPDLIIGVALVAVVALIVVTLLSGGSLASLVRRDNPPELSVTDTTVGGTAPGSSTTGSAGSAVDSDTGQNADGSAAPANNTGANDTSGVDVFVPGVPGEQAGAPASGSGGQAQVSAPGTVGAQTESGGIAQGDGDSSTPALGGPLPEASQSGGFRVAAGAVDSRPAAASLAESYRDADYTVTVEQQNDLYLLWIGPYNTRAEADRVAARLISDGLIADALVYTYDGPDANVPGDDGTGITSTGANADATAAGAGTNVGISSDAATETATATPPANTGAAPAGNDSPAVAATAETNPATPAAPANTGSTGQQYLQVGAFVSDEGAQPLREQLEALGLSVTRRESDTGLVRLLVGPFSTAQLEQTQMRLSAEGLTDAFPVAP